MMWMIGPDMTFGQTVLLAALLMFAGIGILVSVWFLLKALKAANWLRPIPDSEYIEDDELYFYGWEDPELHPVCIRRREEEQRRSVPVERIDPDHLMR